MSAAPTQVQAVGTAFLLKRPLIVAPGAACCVTLLALAGVPRAQMLGLGAGVATLLGLFFVEAWVCRKREVSARWLSWSLRITVLGLAFAAAMSGGVRSPFIPLTLAPVVIAFAAFGRRRESAVMAALFAVLIGGLALIPVGVPFAPIPSPHIIGMTAVAAILALVLGYVGVAQLSDALVSSRETVLHMREDALRAATDRLESLETIGSKLAHELKNPLASIKGLAQLSVRGPEDPKTRKRFEVLLTAARHMEDVLEDYLSFARPLDDLKLGEVDLDALVDEAIALVDGRARTGEVTIRCEGEAGRVNADRRRLLEAVLNLLTNAIEASAAGDRVKVSLRREAGTVVVEVVDEGRGLSRADLSRLGTPYFTTKETGTGLGVVIAMAAVRQHGGDLSYDSEPGKGTQATILLPITEEEEPADVACAGGR